MTRKLSTVSVFLVGSLTVASLAAYGPGAVARHAATDDEAPGLARFPDWPERDIEGKWVLYARDVDENPDAAIQWVPFLRAEQQHELLEWLVLTNANGWSQARKALKELDAPQWIRATLLRAHVTDSHARSSARKDLTDNAALFLGWLALHPSEQERAASIVETIEGPITPDKEAAGRYSPPYGPELFAPLMNDCTWVEFGDRWKAEPRATRPDTCYVHEAERALAIVAGQRDRSPDVVARVLKLVSAPHPRVAESAALAFTHFRPNEVPDEELFQLAESSERDAVTREAAFLAATYGTPARVYVKLHEVLSQPTHLHWLAAVSRIGELGDRFTLVHAATLDRTAIVPTYRDWLDDMLAKIEKRETVAKPLEARIQVLFERAAWADLLCSPLERTLVRWTLDVARAGASSPAVRATLEELQTTYEVAPHLEGHRLFRDLGLRVRRYARTVLGD